MDVEKGHSASYSLLYFLTGAALGTGIALLTARRTGHDTRENLRGGVRKAGDKAKCFYEKGKHYIDDLQRKIRPVMEHEETHVHT